VFQFTDAVELKNHYIALRRKFQGPRPINYVTLPQERKPPEPEPPKKKLSTIPEHLLEQYRSVPVNKKREAVRRIIKEVGEVHGLTKDQMLSDTRKREVVAARHELMYRIRHEIGMSFLEIGAYFKRDHTTIINSVFRHTEKLENDKQYQ
jgi:hypothetical protein